MFCLLIEIMKDVFKNDESEGTFEAHMMITEGA